MQIETPSFTPTQNGIQVTLPTDFVSLVVDGIQIPTKYLLRFTSEYCHGWRDGAKRGLRIAQQFPDPGIVFPTGLEGDALKAWMQGHADAYENIGVNRGIIEAAKPMLESIESGETN